MLRSALPVTAPAGEGVAAFYGALHAGTNPFYCVSSSPWNLYDVLDDFYCLQGIVEGPLLLRDFGIDESKFLTSSHREHKLARIREVLDCNDPLAAVEAAGVPMRLVPDTEAAARHAASCGPHRQDQGPGGARPRGCGGL